MGWILLSKTLALAMVLGLPLVQVSHGNMPHLMTWSFSATDQLCNYTQ